MIAARQTNSIWLLVLFLIASDLYADLRLPSSEISFPPVDMQRVRLGRLLFYDPILSGGKQVSCASCHHPKFGTSDGMSLGLGDGAAGIGSERSIDENNLPDFRIARNSPGLFNLGASQFTALFYDGRLEIDPNQAAGIRSPLRGDMVSGFDSLLSAQAMFPVLAPDEMAGHYGENDVSKAVSMGLLTHNGGAWDILAERVEHIAQYRESFDPIIGADTPISFYHIANVIADFISYEWRALDSPFDAYLKGEDSLSPEARDGMKLFYGKARCDRCHSGLLQTDHQFHAIAMPQLGPGKTGRFEDSQRDTGRFRVTGNIKDLYKFRAPSLRNVELTAPYGHSGAYNELEAVIRHHLNPVASLHAYKHEYAKLPELKTTRDDWAIMNDADEVKAIASANELEPMSLDDSEVQALLSFMHALTDSGSQAGRLGVPATVPSGIPISH
jgi:cytochrome c peroxidase